jgi:recombination protein RecA
LLNDDARAFAARMNDLLKEDIVVCADELVIPRRYTSGFLCLDVILGGGWPGNQWVELIGRESAGKTLVAFKTVAANQKLDSEFTTFWVAAEHYDSEQAEAMGVDNSRVVVASTQQMEAATQLMLAAVESKNFDCIVLDSYPALLPEEEEEKAMDEFTVGVGARLLNKFVRKAGRASRRATDGSERPFIGIIINQFRDKVGGFSKFGIPQTTPGGNGKNYFYYARVEIKRKDYVEEKRPGLDKPVRVGQIIQFETVKNKSAAPKQVTEAEVYFRGAPFKGFRRGDINVAREYVAMGKVLGVITGSSWLTFEGRKFHGEPGLATAMSEEPELQEAIAAAVLEAAQDPQLIDEVLSNE